MISTADLLSAFNRILDTVGSTYYDNAIDFLNDGQVMVYKRFLDPDGLGNKIPGKNAYFESSSKISRYLQPYLRAVSGTTSATGVVTEADISTQIGGREVWGLVGWSDSQDNPVQWKPHGAAVKQRTMSFFAPSECNLWINYIQDGYQLSPEAEMSYKGHVLVAPLTLTDTQGSEFYGVLKQYIAANAALMAATSTRDEEIRRSLIQLIEQIGI